MIYDCDYLDLDIHNFFHDKSGLSVIDLGCGNGSQAYFLEGMGFDVTGTDIECKLEYFITNFIIDDALNSKLNKQYDVIIDRGLIHNLIYDQRCDNYFDMIDRISHDNTTILLKVLSPYEIRCNPHFDDPEGPYRFEEDEMITLYKELGYECSMCRDTYYYGDGDPDLRAYFTVHRRTHA
tara:strand:+ start:624 stop:1163 length:540 start_codon:yes stop_codon:yes gene_type:complete